jgi:hypothetical protein
VKKEVKKYIHKVWYLYPKEHTAVLRLDGDPWSDQTYKVPDVEHFIKIRLKEGYRKVDYLSDGGEIVFAKTVLANI